MNLKELLDKLEDMAEAGIRKEHEEALELALALLKDPDSLRCYYCKGFRDDQDEGWGFCMRIGIPVREHRNSCERYELRGWTGCDREENPRP